jgi:DNA-binding SARP family transcriptional activator
MIPFPIVGARIHPPLLRADTLSRERLNGWLDRAASGRLALIVAEAGFGKTTLLADWARQSRRLTAWYRLEPDDRDWLTFTRHLAASGRELDPGFAPETHSLLAQLGPGGPRPAEILASLVREYAEFGAAHPEGLTLIFDDYHSVDGSDEVVPTVKALLDRTGPGFSLVIASRSTPRLPLSRLRTRGAVSRLGGEALCFDAAETDRLFREAYHQPIERDVIDELVERTEGWPALLSLVHANLGNRQGETARQVLPGLTTSGGDLFDYLAEEVIDQLPAPLARFLTHISLLDELDPEAASVATRIGREQAVGLLRAAEDLSFVVRPDPHSSHRFVPLVREFLRSRLDLEWSVRDVREAHLRIAHHFEASNWRIAATHFLRAGEEERAEEVVCGALEAILGSGQYRAADDLLAAGTGDVIVRDVLRSRLLLQLGATQDALVLATSAATAAQEAGHAQSALAAQSAAAIAYAAGRYDETLAYATMAAESSTSVQAREVAQAYSTLVGASRSANLPSAARQLERLLAAQVRRGQLHYAAITSLNLAQILVWLDRATDALRLSLDADRYLGMSSKGYEIVAARLAEAHARAHLGDWEAAERLLWAATGTDHPDGEDEAATEFALLACWFGPYSLATQLLGRISRTRLSDESKLHLGALDLWVARRKEEIVGALATLAIDPPVAAVAGAAFRWHISRARGLYVLGQRDEFVDALQQSEAIASAQRSPVQRHLIAILRALGDGPLAVSRLLGTWPRDRDPMLGVLAAEVAGQLGELSADAVVVVRRAAARNPQRWREPLRELLASGSPEAIRNAASILEEVGDASDVTLLRNLAGRTRGSGHPWGEVLDRRLAPHILVEDLGPVAITVDGLIVPDRAVRRKVLGMLAFLAAQPNGSATPDQVIEALWPELDPDQGINSVHQTIYYLRRVINPKYRAGKSVDYLRFEREVVYLDPTLIDCRSWICRRLLEQRPETMHAIEDLLANYRGKYAADFAYEEWASAYRDNLHAAFLGVAERAIKGSIGSHDPRWRLWVGQRVLLIDPDADEIEVEVIRLYRILGAPAAAAEQYSHYSAVMREQLGIEPPALEDL